MGSIKKLAKSFKKPSSATTVTATADNTASNAVAYEAPAVRGAANPTRNANATNATAAVAGDVGGSNNPLPEPIPFDRSSTIDRLKDNFTFIEKQLMAQNQQVLEQNATILSQYQQVMDNSVTLQNKVDTLLSANDPPPPPEKKPIECGSYSVTVPGTPTEWRVAGFTSIIPEHDFEKSYFPGLNWQPEESPLHTQPVGRWHKDKTISCVVPCYNENGPDLERTVRSLYRQRLPPGFRIEVVVVMDGADSMSRSMAEYLTTLFGVQINSGSPETDPFVKFPDAETIIVDPLHEESAMTRVPAMEGTIGGYSLVVKRTNHRKANSQMWWLGPHSTVINTKYSLATDCGTVFARTASIHLINRMEAEPSLHAVTGFQRIMDSTMQGDGNYEWFNHPWHFMLRMVQRFEFEVDHVSFKGVYDTLGCMHVIPGPCGLFRHSAMGTLRKGLLHQYFSLFQLSSKGLIVGNVELVEDRIPGTLLSFPLKGDKVEATMPKEGWPKTGFVHNAVFYIEAEKPLSQLVKQRRRWLNGTFATYLWVLSEGLISRSNQDPMTKFCSWLLVVLNVVQGMVVRLFGPSLLIVWMFRFGLFAPDLWSDPTRIFDPELSLVEVELEPGRLKDGLIFSGVYLVLYIAFVIGHTPRAKPVARGESIVRYSEPTAFRNDNKSSYRGWLFWPVLLMNAVVVLLYILNTIGILYTQGWDGTPLLVKILIFFCVVPFIMGLMDGMARCDFRCLWGMIYSAPVALPIMIWFTIWLPAYATTRLSDLTWGNRDTTDLDESEKALRRAKNGQRVAYFLIGFNTFVAVGVIILMQFFSDTFPIFVVTYTLVLSFTYVLSFGDLMYRVLSLSHCYHPCADDEAVPYDHLDDNNEILGDLYTKMDDKQAGNDATSVNTDANSANGGTTEDDDGSRSTVGLNKNSDGGATPKEQEMANVDYSDKKKKESKSDGDDESPKSWDIGGLYC
uniref:chitin synthase n=1 Tax=Odontella aurita TaxID=265563 RepID=A0A7S4ICB3_9STRA